MRILSSKVIRFIKTFNRNKGFQNIVIKLLLIFLSITYSEISIIVLENVNFRVFLNMLALYLNINQKK